MKSIVADGNIYEHKGRAHVLVSIRQNLVLPQFPTETELTDCMRYSVFYSDGYGHPFHCSTGVSAYADGKLVTEITETDVQIQPGTKFGSCMPRKHP